MRGMGVVLGLMTLVVVEASCARQFDDANASEMAAVSHTSGARLRARVGAVDGVAQFLGWVDTKLGVTCSFGEAEDGVLRCLPSRGASLWHCPEELASIRIDEDEATCASAFAPLPSEHSYVASYDFSTACRSSTKIHRAVGDAVMPSGVCKELKKQPGRYQLRAIAPVAPAELVAATERIEARGALSVSVFVADDGAREVRSIVDSKTGQWCVPPYERDAGPCTSDVLYASSSYLDTTCSGPLAIVYGPSPCREASPVRAIHTEDGCGYGELRALGPEVPRSEVRSKDEAGACVIKEPTAGWTFREAGPPLPSGTFPEVSTALVGSRRIVLRAWASSTGERLTARSLFDTHLGEECTRLLIEGVHRCVPASAASAWEYADERCTIPLVPVYEKEKRCGRPLPTLALRRLDCGSSIHVIGARYDGPIFFVDNDGFCARRDDPGAEHFGLGERVDPSRFARIEMTME